MLREGQRLLLESTDIDAVSFRDVFEAAGVSRGSAYRIYIGLDDLLQDIATDWVVNFADFLRGGTPEKPPENWQQIVEFIIRRGAEYWSSTADTLRLLPRLRTSGPASYRLAVQTMSNCIESLFERFCELPDIPQWSQKLGFFTELCDTAFSDAVRNEGAISEQRLQQIVVLGQTYLGFFLPVDLPLRKPAS